MTPEDPDGTRSFFADLHIHSALSPCADNSMIPDRVLGNLVGQDIDVFALTDHNSWFNCAAFERAAKERS